VQGQKKTGTGREKRMGAQQSMRTCEEDNRETLPEIARVETHEKWLKKKVLSSTLGKL